jgi:protein-S-isoprenylcysteine O-methyltransferase Ste14|tara:strand:+ start:34 stop:522 length:489 start_codon:yes stop_codon:yes gene_type:complete
MKFYRPLIKAFLIFPINVMGVIPTFLVWCSRPGGVLERFPYSFSNVRSLVAMLLIAVGAGLCWKTVSLFIEYGEGTPAPFDPPRKLVIRGPYIYMRNPMMVAVCLVLSGEALLFASVPLGLWFLFFFGLCLILIPLWEEPDLEKRFGESYREYKQKVPRWPA